jgi:hypothetical protein
VCMHLLGRFVAEPTSFSRFTPTGSAAPALLSRPSPRSSLSLQPIRTGTHLLPEIVNLTIQTLISNREAQSYGLPMRVWIGERGKAPSQDAPHE